MNNHGIYRLLCLVLLSVIGVSIFSACGNYMDDTKENEEKTTAEITTEAASTEKVPVEIPSEDSEKIYVYSWNDEFDERIQYFREKYPELADLVQYINLDMDADSEQYKEKVEKLLLKGKKAKKYPSIFLTDNGMTEYFLSSDYVIAPADFGITEDMLSDMYENTIHYATVNGELKGLTWQAEPGCFYYRADIAREVIGTDEPEEIQAMVKDWDGFFDMAVMMRESGYFMLSGNRNLRDVCMAESEINRLEGHRLQILDGVKTYLKYAKDCTSDGYEAGQEVGTRSWAENVDGKVFAYFGSPSFLNMVLAENAGDTAGDWRLCKGPSYYHESSSYLCIGKDTPNKALAALVAYTLCCDADVMEKMAEEGIEYVNNKAVIENVVNTEKGSAAMLGGQNPFKLWHESAEHMNGVSDTVDVWPFYKIIDNAVSSYANGDIKTIDDAVWSIKTKIAVDYPEIELE